ncbi:hypothetical protein C9374_013070 [Naegleria lovaniensis]|uniref:RING-type domain-containing protein n=1 Tax=Naegleria lovaniensis TaxID=51637 RepID=A0AA88GC82_NAELO|nr:uncharacterized protein C9374_013070 [Naegleria lovaniensis]KAG2372863.1 hypothetical protein C9374_013070 [Naegleria lovaniensis]
MKLPTESSHGMATLNNNQPIPPYLQCGICHNALDDPIIHIECQLLFCQKCANNSTAKCPQCQTQFTESSLSKTVPRFVTDALQQVTIPCTNCQQMVLRIQMQQHLQNCEIPCRLGCGCRVSPQHQQQHEKEFCTMFQVKCSDSNEWCDWKGPRGELKVHENSCVFLNQKEMVSKFKEKLNEQTKEMEKKMTMLLQEIEFRNSKNMFDLCMEINKEWISNLKLYKIYLDNYKYDDTGILHYFNECEFVECTVNCCHIFHTCIFKNCQQVHCQSANECTFENCEELKFDTLTNVTIKNTEKLRILEVQYVTLEQLILLSEQMKDQHLELNGVKGTFCEKPGWLEQVAKYPKKLTFSSMTFQNVTHESSSTPKNVEFTNCRFI